MSLFSGLVDSIFGEGSSDSTTPTTDDHTGINLDFGLSSTPSTTTPTTTTPSTDSGSSFFSPSNIIGGLSVYSQIAGKKDAAKQAQQQLDAATAAKAQLSAQEFEQQKALLALKASLAGGGGGGGGRGGGGGGGSALAAQNAALAYDAKKTKYLGVLDAMKARQEAQGQGSGNIIQAIKNLTEAAQRPLSR